MAILLVVEDDRPTHSLLATIGRKCGLQVVSAYDGDGAISLLTGGSFTAVILDVLLPGKNGYEVLRHIRSTSPELLSRTIVITAGLVPTSVDSPEVRHVRRSLRKPLDVTELMDELTACAKESE